MLAQNRVNIDSKESSKSKLKRTYQSLKINLLSILGKSTFHGFPSLSSENVQLKLKVLWVACMCASWGYFAYQAYNTILLIQAYPKVTLISKTKETVPEFPAVDLCDLNAYDGGVTRSYMEWVLEQKNISINASSNLREYIDNSNDQLKSFIDTLWKNGTLNTYYASFYLTQILLNCKFQGKTCSFNDFYWYHNYNYGNCFRFNGGADLPNQTREDSDYRSYSTKKSYKTGWHNGLRLELYAGSQLYQMQFGYKTGFRIIVHNQSVIPFPDQDGIDIPAGTQTNIGLKRKFLSRLPSPYSNCIDQLTEDVAKQNDILAIMYEKKQSNEIKQYQANYCMGICYQKFVVEICNCSSLSLSLLNLNLTNNQGYNIEGCYQKNDVNCMISADKEFYNTDKVRQCYSLCPNECNLMSYDLKISQAAYPTQWYADANNIDTSILSYLPYTDNCDIYNCLKKSASIVNIFYESNEYTLIKETPQLTLDYIVGNFGGNLSLFTGMSFLSIAELFEVVLTALIIFFNS